MAQVADGVMKRFSTSSFAVAQLVAAKSGLRVSVCIPARNEETTIGPIVADIHDELVADNGLVDEIVVIDDHSDDQTAALAAEAGAIVVPADAITLPDIPAEPGMSGGSDGDDPYRPGHGKGEALWRSMHASTGDIIIWCDGDLVDFTTDFIVGLAGPLLTDPSIAFVKADYERPLHGQPDGGGRVTELVARPALTLLFPVLAELSQPLAGEYAGRREVLEQLPFSCGYGVDVGLVIDISLRFGSESIAQVDLGVRRHRNRPIEELGPMATEVLAAMFARSGTLPGSSRSQLRDHQAVLWRRGTSRALVNTQILPPPIEMPSYRQRWIDLETGS